MVLRYAKFKIFAEGPVWQCVMFDVMKAKNWEKVVEALTSNVDVSHHKCGFGSSVMYMCLLACLTTFSRCYWHPIPCDMHF